MIKNTFSTVYEVVVVVLNNFQTANKMARAVKNPPPIAATNGVEGTVACYRYSVTVTGYSVTVTGYSINVTGYSVTVTGYSSLPLKNCLTMAISVAPLR